MPALFRERADGTVEYKGATYVRRDKALAEEERGAGGHAWVVWWRCYGCDRSFPYTLGSVPRFCCVCGAGLETK